MINDMVCAWDESPEPFVAAAVQDAARRYLEFTTEEPGMSSPSGDTFRIMWTTLTSGTSSVLRLWRKDAPIRRGPVSVSEVVCGIFPEEADTALQEYFERQAEVRFVPPEESWKPMRANIIVVDEFPLNLEP